MQTALIYTKNDCVWCTKVKTLLESKGLLYVVRNIDEDEAALMDAATFKTMPQVFIDGIHIGGYEATENHLAKGPTDG
jgi:glutaredoxin